MATHSTITPKSGDTPLAALLPRRTAIQAAITALEPLLTSEGNRASTYHTSLQTIFDQLMDELWACDTVILATHPANADELHAQAAIARASIQEHLADMPLVRDFLARAEGFAA